MQGMRWIVQNKAQSWQRDGYLFVTVIEDTTVALEEIPDFQSLRIMS